MKYKYIPTWSCCYIELVNLLIFLQPSFKLQEKQRMTDKLEDTSLRLKDEMDLYRKIMDKVWQNRHEFQKEKEAMQEVRHPHSQKTAFKKKR